MKKVINMLFMVFTSALLANAFELESMTAKDVNKVMEETPLIIPEPVKAVAQSPYHAAEQLREELRLRGIFANVTVVQMSPKRALLVAEFPNWEVFKEVQDIFTTDDHGNLFYMGYPVRPQVPREKIPEIPSVKAPRTIFSCQTVKVYDDSFFEESLSVEEYPDVYMTDDKVAGKKVHIGGSLFSERERDSIQITPSAGFDMNVTVKPSNDDTVYSIAIRHHNSGTGLKKEGMVFARIQGHPPVKVAKLACE